MHFPWRSNRSPVLADAPVGLCPRCLVQAGFESQPAAQAGTEPTVLSPSHRFEPPTVEELAPLFPQLEILQLLGKGGMGAVYKARQRQLDRLVALKILPAEISHDPAFAERFAREARALAKLNHPHIVAVYDFGQTEANEGRQPFGTTSGQLNQGADAPRSPSLCYFVMEYVDGANLRQVIQRGDVKPDEALAIIPQICEALQYAHEHGVIHRDIKPENILLDSGGRVKIADFGLAKLLEHDAADHSLTATNQVMGTLKYMAPEQLEGSHHVDHRADIYSLGVIFYELLTRELPIGRFAPPSKIVAIDVRLDEVVLRSLEKEPEQRYQHASDLKTAIEQMSIVGQVPAPPPIIPPVVSDRLPQLTVTVVAGVAGGLSMAVGVALAVFAVLTASPSSGVFWAWMGGAFGCFLGGGGALIGAINRYRQLKNEKGNGI